MEYTDEELASLPQTQQVFDTPDFNFGEHIWVQQNYEIIDSCKGCMRQGVPIPNGKMLIKEKGAYKIVDEVRT